MKNKPKVPCKGCHNLILVSTAQKYHGYSRQCQQKALLEKSLVQPLAVSAEQGRPTQPNQEDIRFFLLKTNIKFPKLYYFEQFVRVWALSGDLDFARNRYQIYLSKLEKHIDTLTTDLLRSGVYTQKEVLA